MKRIIFSLVACFITMSSFAQDLKTVKLNTPDKNRGSSFMKTLSDRHSTREFSNKDLSLQDLSDLLWAANGVNRTDGRRTAPTAMNKQEIDIYVVRADGAYLYNATTNELQPIAKGDFRKEVAGRQEFAATAPISLVMVINLEKLGDPKSEQTRLMGAVDAGNVSQNINLFCSATSLVTVPRATMDIEALKKTLKLSDTQLPIMNNPVGYPKK